MARNVDIFQTKAQGQYIYQQYQKLEWLKKYAKFIDEYIQKNYFDKLKSMWETMDVGESLDPYLTFYTKWLFGLYRPLGGASISDYYDLNLLYDNGRIFDDAQEADGLIQGEDYLKYIKFIYNYTQETWHIDHIIAFVADYCKIDPTDIYVDYSNKNVIKIKIPSTALTGADFIKLTINYYDAMCLPFPNVLDFVLMQETDDFWRGIIYTPYTELKSLKEWYSPLEKYKAKNDKYSVLYSFGMLVYLKKFQHKETEKYLIDYFAERIIEKEPTDESAESETIEIPAMIYTHSTENDNATYQISSADLAIQADAFTKYPALQSLEFKENFFYSVAKDSDNGTITFNGTPQEFSKDTFILADTTNRVVATFSENKAVNFSLTYTIANRVESEGVISAEALFNKDVLSNSVSFYLAGIYQCDYTVAKNSVFCIDLENADSYKWSYSATKKDVYCKKVEIEYNSTKK